MLCKTRALVLSYTPVGDTDLVLRTFTPDQGKLSFFVYRYKGKKSVIKSSLLMPLMPIEIEAIIRPNGDLHKLSEVKPLSIGLSIHHNPYKLAQCYFMAEMLQNLHFEAQDHQGFFNYNMEILKAFHESDDIDSMLPLYWLIELITELGIRPVSTDLPHPFYFDIKEAEFLPFQPSHPLYLEAQESFAFNEMLKNKEMKYSKEIRNKLIYAVLDFFKIHASDFREPKCLQVYAEMLE